MESGYTRFLQNSDNKITDIIYLTMCIVGNYGVGVTAYIVSAISACS